MNKPGGDIHAASTDICRHSYGKLHAESEDTIQGRLQIMCNSAGGIHVLCSVSEAQTNFRERKRIRVFHCTASASFAEDVRISLACTMEYQLIIGQSIMIVSGYTMFPD